MRRARLRRRTGESGQQLNRRAHRAFESVRTLEGLDRLARLPAHQAVDRPGPITELVEPALDLEHLRVCLRPGGLGRGRLTR
jgi:hypothetical protein